MDPVFAPWRMEWIEREDKNPEVEECVFCELPGFGADRKHRIVARSDHAYVLLNNAPYNPGHVMVIPYRHTGDYRELDPETLLDHSRLVQATLDALERAMDPDGFNAGLNLGDGAAGGSVGDHLHTHVVPRWEGDTNFMPVVADTAVIVEALDDTYGRLHDAFATMSSVDGTAEGTGETVGDGDDHDDAEEGGAVRLGLVD